MLVVDIEEVQTKPYKEVEAVEMNDVLAANEAHFSNNVNQLAI